MIDKSRQPVIVGVGRHTQRRPASVEEALNPVELTALAARKAASDVGVADPSVLLKDLVGVSTGGMFFETRWMSVFKKKPFTNFSKSLSDDLGATPEKIWRSFPGGNGPQFCISKFADLIEKGEIGQGPILVAGCEDNSTFDRAVREGKTKVLKERKWDDPNQSEKPEVVNREYRIDSSVTIDVLRQELGHGLLDPIGTYALFENSYCHARGVSREEHHARMARLFSQFSLVAAAQPEHSWFPQAKSPEELLTVTEKNRMLAYPYTKSMVARDEVDQSAAILLMSWAEAERRGVPEDKIIFIWGSGDAYDNECISLRPNLARSVAMEVAYREAFRSAGLDLDKGDAEKVACFDIYSCFPIAVEHACDVLGFDVDKVDVARITATGGLPYHGGPGSNYSAHGMCALAEKLRTDYYRGKVGMLAANGGMLTEHSIGLYSTSPPPRNYVRRDHNDYAPVREMPPDMFALVPNGEAKVIAWGCKYARKPNVPAQAYIVGELTSGAEAGKRFCAISKEEKTINWLLEKCRIGEKVTTTCSGKKEKIVRHEAYIVNFSPAQTSSL